MDAVTGLNIANTEKAESPEHVSDLLREATEAGTPVLPVGGGACLSTGHPVDHEFLALDLSGLSGILDYNPTDMTAGFLAGTPVRDVTEALAENGQELPVDLAADDAGTIGGLVATGFSGPRRYGQGTLKDLLIGCEYVRGDGLEAKAGGMTVKNVSGYEISRMLHGSWGSLAVLTRVNLKVLPRPRVDRTLTWNDDNAANALARQQRLLEHFPGAVAIQSVQKPDRWETSIRFSGRAAAVDDYERQATGLEGEAAVTDESDSVWAPGAANASAPQLVLSAPAVDMAQIVDALVSAGGISRLTASYGTGTVRAEISQSAFSRSTFSHLGSSLWMIEGGEDTWKHDVPVWGPDRSDRAVMKSIKQQFDPANILNRGRLFI